LAAPFFYTDGQRSYFVSLEPATRTISNSVSAPIEASIGKAYVAAPSNIYAKAAAVATVASGRALEGKPWARAAKRSVAQASGATLQSFAEASNGAAVASQDKGLTSVASHEYFAIGSQSVDVPTIKATFTPFFHPFIDEFAVAIRKYGLEKLFSEE